MYDDKKTPLDKAIGAVSILSDPTEERMKGIAKMYSIPWNVLKKLIEPIDIKGRIIYVSIDKAKTIKEKKLARSQWSRGKSRELIGHLPNTVVNKKHGRKVKSGNADSPKDLDTKGMRRKVVSQLSDSKKEHINNQWEKLTSQ